MRFAGMFLIFLLVHLPPVFAQSNSQHELENLAVITASNASQLFELRRMGMGTIHAAAWSPDGHLIALGGSLGVWLYNAQDFSQSPTLLADTSAVDGIAFSPDSKWLVVSARTTTKLWNLAAHQESPVVLPNGVYALAFSPDGRLLGTGDSTGQLRLWNMDAQATDIGKLISTFQSDIDKIIGDIAFTPNSEEIMAFQGRVIQQWRVRDGALLSTFDTIKPDVFGNPSPALRQFDPYDPYRAITGGVTLTRGSIQNGNIVSIPLEGGESGKLTLLDSLSGFEYWSQSLFENDITAVAFSKDRESIAVANEEGVITIVDAHDGETKESFITEGASISTLIFSPDDSRLLSLSQFDKAVLWDVKTGALIATFTDNFAPRLFDVAISPDKTQIAAGIVNPVLAVSDVNRIENVGSLRRWDIASAQLASSLFQIPDITSELQYRPDGKQIAAINNLYYVDLLDTESLDELRPLTLWHEDIPFVTIAYSPNSRLIVSTSEDQTAQLWDTDTGETFGSPLQLNGTGQSAVFTPDSRYVIIGTDNGFLETWDAQTRQRVIEPISLGWPIKSVDISPDSRVILAGGRGVQLLDFYTGDVLATFDDGYLNMPAAFNRDSSLVISGSGSNIQLWNTCTGQLLSELRGHNDFIEDFALSEDGTLLASMGHDGTIRLWGVPEVDESKATTTGANCRITPTPIPTITFTPTLTLTPNATSIPSATVTHTPTATPLPASCQGAPLPRLISGEQGRVLDDDPSPINMRDGGGLNFNRIGQIPAGGIFQVLSDAVCADAYFWYEVDYNGTRGWIAEGDGANYYTEPNPGETS